MNKRMNEKMLLMTIVQETPVLRYHSIKPGDRLSFYRRNTVHKLMASVNRRLFLIPVSHKGHFSQVDDGPSTGLPVTLAEVAGDSTFPFRLRYRKQHSGAVVDPALPEEVHAVKTRLPLLFTCVPRKG